MGHKQPTNSRVINLFLVVILALFLFGLIVTIIKAYWLWLVLVLAGGVLLFFGGRYLIRVLTTRTWHR
ncbi:hypothetical protein C8250_029065 [Streptomyces sp. So13.3]|uniref:hypothetical protein n=1 Tax=Streptomyces sp. So13.3 TaxID=2136173 RepID=UPI001106AFE2|nr:hypothetical protein [Streptomyces sp. So13.3]QNA75402.1 hypothetical protein C8250_029065 [Streptomyces sp. So13.3]